MTTFKEWIAELKTKTNHKDVLAVLEKMEKKTMEVSEESIKKGNLLTLKLCMEGGTLPTLTGSNK